MLALLGDLVTLWSRGLLSRIDKVGVTSLEKGTTMPTEHSPEKHRSSRSQQALRAVRSQLQPGSLPLLCGANLLLYLLKWLAVDSTAAAILVQLSRVGVMGASLYVLSSNRVTLWLGILVAGLVLTLQARVWGLDPQVNRVLEDSIATGFGIW